MNEKDISEILRRWQAGQPIAYIARVEDRDRKTIRGYIKKIEHAGLASGSFKKGGRFPNLSQKKGKKVKKVAAKRKISLFCSY